MAFEIPRIKRELEGGLIASPYPFDLAAAIVSDTFRLGGVVPPTASVWKGWLAKRKKTLFAEQLGMLAHILIVSSARTEAVKALQEGAVDPLGVLPSFFDKVEPLTAEMIRANVFRQEEFLRRFIECLAAKVHGETAKASKERLAQLDYRTTLEDYRKADTARKAEAQKRAKLLQEARDREAAARGWRE